MKANPLFLPTNRYNVIPALTRRLVLPRQGYEKYYADLLELRPGHIILSTGAIAPEVAEFLGSDGAHSFAVLLELTGVRAENLGVEVPTGDRMESSLLPTRSAVPVIAPTLHFATQDHLEEFAARRYANIDLRSLDMSVSPDLFEADGPGLDAITEQLESLPENDDPSGQAARTVDRLGGAAVMAMNASASEIAADISRRVLEDFASAKDAGFLLDDLARVLPKSAPDSEHDGALLQATYAALLAHADLARNAPGEFIASLRAALSDKPTDLSSRSVNENLDRIAGIIAGEIPLRRFQPKGLASAKALLLYLLRPGPEDVLTWLSEDTGASDDTLVLAASFSGLAAGLSALSPQLRGTPKLQNDIALASADLLNQTAEPPVATYLTDGLNVKTGVTETRPGWLTVDYKSGRSILMRNDVPEPTHRGFLLRADFKDPDAATGALKIAERLGWVECVVTTITFKEGSLSTLNRMTALSIRGEWDLTTSLDADAFVSRLSAIAAAKLDELLASSPPQKEGPARSELPQPEPAPETTTVRQAPPQNQLPMDELPDPY